MRTVVLAEGAEDAGDLDYDCYCCGLEAVEELVLLDKKSLISDFIIRPSFPVPLIFFKEILCSLAIALTEGVAST